MVGVEEFAETTETDSLLKAFPNPFNAQTTIKFALSKSVDVRDMTFKIYNVLGQVVFSFMPEVTSAQNKFQFIWDGRNESGAALPSGNYFFVASTAQKNFSLKLLLIK